MHICILHQTTFFVVFLPFVFWFVLFVIRCSAFFLLLLLLLSCLPRSCTRAFAPTPMTLRPTTSSIQTTNGGWTCNTRAAYFENMHNRKSSVFAPESPAWHRGEASSVSSPHPRPPGSGIPHFGGSFRPSPARPGPPGLRPEHSFSLSPLKTEEGNSTRQSQRHGRSRSAQSKVVPESSCLLKRALENAHPCRSVNSPMGSAAHACLPAWPGRNYKSEQVTRLPEISKEAGKSTPRLQAPLRKPGTALGEKERRNTTNL